MASKYTLGSNQVMRVVAESAYGTAVEGTPTWIPLGLTTDGDIGSKTFVTKIYGIGQATPQAKHAGKVDNDVKCTLVSPSASILNYAVTRTAGVLGSFNVAAGDAAGAWLLFRD